jgi:hypothetical protein
LDILSGSASVESCTFCEQEGDAISLSGIMSSIHLTIRNTIIAFSDGYGVGASTLHVVTAECCDIYGNTHGDWVLALEGQQNLNGNLCEDPLFCSRDQGDLGLDCVSPCAPEYNQECGLIGLWPVACGASGAEPTSWGSLKARFRD